jgi:ERCC4-type nuclease
MIQVQIDVREQELIQQIQHLISTIPSFKELELKIETLPLGDILLGTQEETMVLIERKSINDLIASIKDGRYEEQSYRLNGLNHPNHNILYLVEGDLNKMNRFRDTRMEKLTLYSAIFSLNYTKGFSVIRTFSMEESAIFICNSAVKLKKNILENKRGYYQLNTESTKPSTLPPDHKESENQEKEGSDKDYVSVVKKTKKENITPDNMAEIMLCQIPGISSVTALAIMEKYPTLYDLLQVLQENPDCLKDVCYQTEKGQTRKINKTCIENIRKYLLKK